MTTRFDIEERYAGMRLDRALAEHFGLSRAAVKRLIEAGAVTLRGLSVQKGLILRPGASLEVVLESADDRAQPDSDFRLRVLFEDEALVLVDKPAGIPSHPLRVGELGCAANMLLARYPEMREIGYSAREPGLVNRLDNDTSGILVAARTPEAFAKLRSDLQQGAIQKTYLALLSRAVSVPQSIELALSPSAKHSSRVELSSAANAHPARTELISCRERGRFFLVEARTSHAYRHQLRVHLAALDAPIVGDRLYGGELGVAPEPERHLLHASRIALRHPQHGRAVDVDCPLPADWP